MEYNRFSNLISLKLKLISPTATHFTIVCTKLDAIHDDDTDRAGYAYSFRTSDFIVALANNHECIILMG